MSTLSAVLLGFFIFFTVIIAGFILFNKKKASAGGDKGTKETWLRDKWNEKKKEPMFWLIATLILAYAAHAIFGADKANVARAVVVLIGFHLVWWLLSTGKSWITPVFVYGIGAYFVLAWLQPEDTETIRDSSLSLTSKGYHGIATSLKTLDGKASKTSPANEPSQQSAIVPAVYQSVTFQPQTLQVVPGGGFRKVNIPPGRVLKDLTWDCPNGCILEIVHEGQPLCSTEEKDKYQGQPCGVVPVEVGGSGVQRYREQFVTPYGHFISFPRDIAVVGVAFGTDENLGPIEAIATITL